MLSLCENSFRHIDSNGSPQLSLVALNTFGSYRIPLCPGFVLQSHKLFKQVIQCFLPFSPFQSPRKYLNLYAIFFIIMCPRSLADLFLSVSIIFLVALTFSTSLLVVHMLCACYSQGSSIEQILHQVSSLSVKRQFSIHCHIKNNIKSVVSLVLKIFFYRLIRCLVS